MSSAEPTRTLRTDARENREKLVRAAAARFAAEGSGVALESIARTAGVGVGTLYRHFPTREALVEAVYRKEVDALCACSGELLAELPADAALEAWMERFIAYAATERGLSAALKSVASSQSELFAATRERLLTAIGALLGAGIATGRLRDDVTADDVLTAMNAVWTISDEGEQWAARARRVLRLLMDALRVGS
ncbi:MAG TPA: TetR/AcrR family transcriptional regulator [Solirubrobacteraceae bacterium]|jgi:AcrR family transcriptional regulator|nr:TetR/AcrR family transcriptional regulator [Solirubrobacteraceae bacterium]